MYILYIYTCICIRIHANLPRKAMVGPSHSWSGDSRDQETFLTHSADKKLATITQRSETTMPPNRHKEL